MIFVYVECDSEPLFNNYICCIFLVSVTHICKQLSKVYIVLTNKPGLCQNRTKA